MVAVIHNSSSLKVVLNYNEHKVKAGVAVCLEAAYYPKAVCDLNFFQKLSRLEKLTELNPRTKINSVHISLNFDPSEKLSDERLKEVAFSYLERLGFAGQPYLLYRHDDAGHPHVHLLTTNIRPDGSRISLHNLGRDVSPIARRAVEQEFGLVRAEDQPRLDAYQLKPVNAREVMYGHMETRRAISNVLQVVMKKYQFASLPELNAVLGLYNVQADRGAEGSRVFKHGGLLYQVLDPAGKKVGIPIKASSFYGRPGLAFLTSRFAENAVQKKKHFAALRVAIDRQLLGGKQSLESLAKGLQQLGVDLVVRRNDDGVVYGLTFVDHRSGCIANGRTLGPAYSAKGIQAQCVTGGPDERKKDLMQGRGVSGDSDGGLSLPDLAGVLLDTEPVSEQMDWNLKRKKRKKKRLRPEGN